MDDVKRKVLLDLFAAPSTLLPVVGGLTALMASWAFGPVPWLSFTGLAGVLAGAGIFATRLIFGLEGMTDRAYRYLVEQQAEHREKELDKLARGLRRDGDPRTHQCLKDLRTLYETFQQDVEQNRTSGAARTMAEKVDALFQACVDHLNHSLALYRSAKKLSKSKREPLLDQRERIVDEVVDTINHLQETIRQFHSFAADRKESDLNRLRRELDETMRVARRTEERIATIEKDQSYDVSEFETE